jgi:hypothetical protein
MGEIDNLARQLILAKLAGTLMVLADDGIAQVVEKFKD